MSISRRRFLEDSLFAAAAAAFASSCAQKAAGPAASAAPPSGAKSPNDTIRVAIIGVNGRGMAHVKGFVKQPGVEVVTICDLDEKAAAKAIKAVQDSTGKAPAFERDLRKVCEDKSIDVISVATPNHWHSLAAIWAIQAGKDVYVEKPVSHNVHEGRTLVAVARKQGKICQVGSQSRTNPGMRQLIDYVRSGKIGKVTVARGLCYKRRDTIGKVGTPVKPPSTVDYNLWLGPAPARADVPRTKFHYDWHWQWDYGNGDIGNQGVHEMDKARWGLGKNTLPRSVVSYGGRFAYEDDGQTPNTQVCVYDYGDSQLVFEVRGLPTEGWKGAKVGNIFHGSEGYAVSTSYSSGTIFDLKGQKVTSFEGGANHFENFLNAVRSRKWSDLTADVEEGHLSAALCHLGNISYRLGAPEPLAKKPAYLLKNKEAQETFARFEEHLKSSGVDLAKTAVRMGRELTVDPKTETFTNGSKDANSLLARDYRKGFAVPNKA
jgi:predicted dehydrogenase